MKNVTWTISKSLFKKIFLMCSVLCTILWVVGSLDLIKGLIFGAVVGWLNFFMMGKEISSVVKGLLTKGSKKSGRIMVGYFIRFGILVLAFAVVGKYNSLNPISFVVGLFLVQISLYLEYILGAWSADN